MKSSEPNTPRRAPSQATGRVQPCRRPTQAIVASSASRADTTSSTWAGPAAWRKVPHVVATGKTRLVTRNVAKATMTTGRMAAPRIAQGNADEADDRDRHARDEQHAEQVVAEPFDPHLDQSPRPDGEVARQGRRVVPGEDVEAGDRERVGHGLAGERAAERDPVPDRPGQEDQPGDDGDGGDEPDTRRRG